MTIVRRIRSLVLLFALAPVLLLAGPSLADSPSQAPVVVHLGHFTDDLHGASMALSIANMLQKRKVPVTLFLDREGVRLVDARVPQNLQWARTRRSSPSTRPSWKAAVRSSCARIAQGRRGTAQGTGARARSSAPKRASAPPWRVRRR